MVFVLAIASFALAVVSAVSGHVIRHRKAPPNWETAILEPYATFHARYLKLDCYDKHNTTYFDSCCHPLLKDESISVLYDLNCFSTGEDDCDDGSSSVPHPTTYSPPSPEQQAPTSSPSVPATHSPEQDKPSSPPPAYTTPSLEPSKSVEHTSAEPTSTPKVTSPQSSPANTGSNDGGNFNFGGQATFFYQNGNAGACGTVHQDSDFVAAMDSARYDASNGSGSVSSLCGKKVEIINISNGKSVVVVVADSCPTCNNQNSIDLSKAAFENIATLAEGEVDIKWRFV